MEIRELERLAQLRRADAVTMIARAKTGHTGGCIPHLGLRPGPRDTQSPGIAVTDPELGLGLPALGGPLEP